MTEQRTYISLVTQQFIFKRRGGGGYFKYHIVYRSNNKTWANSSNYDCFSCGMHSAHSERNRDKNIKFGLLEEKTTH